MSTVQQQTTANNDEISLKELLQKAKEWWQYLLTKWLIILVFGLGGAVIGLITSLLTPPKYTAKLSFALVEKSAGGGGLADLASSFGLSSMLGGGSSGAFSGDNLLEIMQSPHTIQQTLLSPVVYQGKKQNLVEVYIQFNELRDKWKKKDNKELQILSFPIGQKRETFTRTQDSVLNSIYDKLIKSNALTIARKDKKLSFVNVNFTSKDEVFSKLFEEKLMEVTYGFYKETRTAQSRANINMMQAKADSIRRLYESSLYRSAGYSQVNINQALAFAAVPKIKQENNSQLYATVYTEVLKNLETLKLDLARETPIVQIIDTPRFPLEKERLGKAKAMATGGILGGFLIVFYLLGAMFLKNALEE
ncbi:lipopolysaccharide biosynthesis protein [Paludibacter propionicigenes WB4]|uniref:Lipopolysaccharide biosynthesis protein n=1 Tax=Paludibacter propionicigenes (strain DSM 17365 / JCM 13257 / WB4) TaxID=694427 RepID=E4T332_PALPW|nr:LPS biosynthesis protein [Paludibacter propionicigenes]ADQ79126.1 lipopolysaccharide biosynthesis protein [Paludibacter propionicigenes WB4]